jgi:hypothetical protein
VDGDLVHNAAQQESPGSGHPLRATTIRWAVCPSTAAIDEIVQPGVNLNPAETS